MKKIFFIINCFSKGGGAESLLAQIVNRLNPQKYEIGIMEIIHDNIKEEKLNSNIRLYPYYVEANMSKYLASIIDIINHDVSVEKVRSSNDKIMDLMKKGNAK